MQLNYNNLYRLLMVVGLIVTLFAFIATRADNLTHNNQSLIEVVADGSYLMGDSDTVSEAKARALDLARQKALKKVGVFISSTTTVSDRKLVERAETAIQANIVHEEVIRNDLEVLEGRPHYIVEAKFAINTDAIHSHIKALDTLEKKNGHITKLTEQNIRLKELLTSALDALKAANFADNPLPITDRQKSIVEEASHFYKLSEAQAGGTIVASTAKRLDAGKLSPAGPLDIFDFHFNQYLDDYAIKLKVNFVEDREHYSVNHEGKTVATYTWRLEWKGNCNNILDHVQGNDTLELMLSQHHKILDAYLRGGINGCFLTTKKGSSNSSSNVLFNKNRIGLNAILIKVTAHNGVITDYRDKPSTIKYFKVAGFNVKNMHQRYILRFSKNNKPYLSNEKLYDRWGYSFSNPPPPNSSEKVWVTSENPIEKTYLTSEVLVVSAQEAERLIQ